MNQQRAIDGGAALTWRTGSRPLSERAMELMVGLLLVVGVAAGGSSIDTISAGVVRLASIPVAALAIWRACFFPVARRQLWPVLLLAATILVAVAHVIPLPPEVWTRVPGRETVAAAYRAAGLALPALPLSLVPPGAFNGVLGLIPPAAIFLGAIGLDQAAQRRLALLLIGLAICSVALGALQIFGGPASPLRFYEYTNRGAAVGFFANRNHQASFLAAMIPLVAALAVRSTMGRRAGAGFAAVVAGAVGLVLVLGVGITLSRAGVLLLVPALLASVLIASRSRRGAPQRTPSALPAAALAGSMVLGAALLAAFQFTPLAQRFLGGEATRPEVSLRVAEIGRLYAPFGSGVGSFEAVYQMHEPADALSTTYFNHAHNDYVEIWLEAGWPGVALVLAFLAWWAAALAAILRHPSAQSQLVPLAGAAMVGMLLVHALADYPLRTSASAIVFAFGCALMAGGVAPPQRPRREKAGNMVA